VSDIAGAYLLLEPIDAFYESPFTRASGVRGIGGDLSPSPTGGVDHHADAITGSGAPSSTQTGEFAYRADALTGAGTQPPTAAGAVAHQPVSLAGAVT
jgi:hypothetical protein